MAEASESSKIIEKYADLKRLNGVWALSSSPLGGRGLFAKKNLPPSFEIFREPPLLIGPRADPCCSLVCVGCHKNGKLRACSKNCGLPVCSVTCEEAPLHKECSLFQKFPESQALSVRDRLALVAPLRAVFLGKVEREILGNLERHDRPDQMLLVQRTKALLEPEAHEVFRTCCQVLDATAFETPTPGGSVRGIYPLAALMNHDCVPNTHHCFDSEGRMVVETTKSVILGEELTTTYTCLTWGSQTRRAHLMATKRFICRCRRCKDPTEFGSRLMALYCMRKGCVGVLLPSNGESQKQPWVCTVCAVKVPAMRISVIQKMISETISKVEGRNPKEACRVLSKNTLVPASNSIAVEFKLSLVRLYGNEKHKGFAWSDLTVEDLLLKQLLCVQLISLFSLLGLGLCRQRGFLLLELAGTINELKKRDGATQMACSRKEIPQYKSISEIYEEAKCILRNDASTLLRTDLQQL